jgi:hypothetical protein
LNVYNENISNKLNMGSAPIYFGVNSYISSAVDGSIQFVSSEPQVYMHGLSLGATGSSVGSMEMTGSISMDSSTPHIFMGNNTTHGINIAGDGNLQLLSGTGGTVYASGLTLGSSSAWLGSSYFSGLVYLGSTANSVSMSGDGNLNLNSVSTIYVNGKDIGASTHRGGTAYFATFDGNGDSLTYSTRTNGFVVGATTATTNLASIITPAGSTNLWNVTGNVRINNFSADTAKMVVLFKDESNTWQSNGMSAVLSGDGNYNVSSQGIWVYPGSPIYLVVTLPTATGSINYNAAGGIKMQ